MRGTSVHIHRRQYTFPKQMKTRCQIKNPTWEKLSILNRALSPYGLIDWFYFIIVTIWYIVHGTFHSTKYSYPALQGLLVTINMISRYIRVGKLYISISWQLTSSQGQNTYCQVQHNSNWYKAQDRFTLFFWHNKICSLIYGIILLTKHKIVLQQPVSFSILFSH